MTKYHKQLGSLIAQGIIIAFYVSVFIWFYWMIAKLIMRIL